jgi:hypothetical protein
MVLNNEVINRGKVKQTETFQSPSDHWKISSNDGIFYTPEGGVLEQSLTLTQSAKTTFGFLRLMFDATLNITDQLSLQLISQNEVIELIKTKDKVQLLVNQQLIKEVEYTASSVTLQLVINDERVGCFVIGNRIHTLANRLPIASFYNQPFVFDVTSTIEHQSKIILKELVYEYVNE